MTQEEALDILKLGHNVFLTGPAGSGKTFILNQYTSYLKERRVAVALTASTGIAATHIGGTTIHSWSGLGIKDELTEWDLEMLSQRKSLYKRFSETSVLVIDEISMLDAKRIDMLDELLRFIRRENAPFGGLQVIFTGDFFQLPPVVRGEAPVYAFNSRFWNEHPPVVCYLETQFRQQSEDPFSLVLEKIRTSSVDASIEALLKERMNQGIPKGLEVTKLYTHNVDVDRINEEELGTLSAKEHIFNMTSKGSKKAVDVLKKGCLAPEVLRLKEGSRVMFVKNDPLGRYMNGSLGVVEAFEHGVPQVRLNSGTRVFADYVTWSTDPESSTKAEISQIPLRLAWAITIHKSQGMTLDAALIDLSRTFVEGQGYVALSRVRSFDGLFLDGFHPYALSVDGRVALADIQFKRRSERARARIQEIDIGSRERKAHEFILRCGGIVDIDSIEAHKKESIETKQKLTTLEKTEELVRRELPLEEIARERKLKVETIISHIEKIKDLGVALDIEYLMPDTDQFKEMLSFFKKSKDKKLSPALAYFKANGVDCTFEELRFVRLFS